VAPYWRSDQKLSAWALLGTIVALTLGGVYMNVLYNDWNRQFYDALQDKDWDSFKSLLIYFCALATGSIVLAVFRVYLSQLLEIRWRAWLTERYIGAWLANKAYYRLELESHGTDNPDQRISEDLRNLTTGTLSLALGLLSSVVTLASFVLILWAVSGPLTVALGGMDVTIPGYMVWVAILYAIIGSVLTHYVGRRLITINFQQERFEADFRFSLVRLRENAEGVALYHGEESERSHLRHRFGNIQMNWDLLMRYTRRLTVLNVGYNQVAIIFPLLVAAPRYFSGEIALGGLMQVGNAFEQVQDSLSWFVNTYSSLADWKASVDRLLTFHDALARIGAVAAHDEGIHVQAAPAPVLRAEGLTLALPNGRTVLAGADFAVNRGEHVLVSGPSGSGKSTLFRALAGIWPFGRGTVTMPADAKILFLPQKPYIPIGTLREAVSYPADSGAFDDAALREALETVRLPGLADRLDESQNWSLQLSGGEQQRLAVARALLQRPDWLFLDEATSALDAPTEEHIAALLRERLPDATILSIAHRPVGDEPQDLTIDLSPVAGGATSLASHRNGSTANGTAGLATAPAPSAAT
jgi:putative ATP-binding cassette transporter